MANKSKQDIVSSAARPQERSFNVLHSLCAVSSAWTFQLASWVSIFTKKTAGPQKCFFDRGCGNVTEAPSLELTYSRFPLKGTFEDVFLGTQGGMC